MTKWQRGLGYSVFFLFYFCHFFFCLENHFLLETGWRDHLSVSVVAEHQRQFV